MARAESRDEDVIPGAAKVRVAAARTRQLGQYGGVVAHEPCVVLAGERGEIGQRREVALHAEYAVGHDEAVPVACALLGEQRARVRDVVVAELDDARAAELGAREQAAVA